MCNLKINHYIRDVLELEVVTFIQRIPEAVISQGNARAHISRKVQDFFSSQQLQLTYLVVYLPDMSLIEHYLVFCGQSVARDIHPVADTAAVFT